MTFATREIMHVRQSAATHQHRHEILRTTHGQSRKKMNSFVVARAACFILFLFCSVPQVDTYIIILVCIRTSAHQRGEWVVGLE